MTVCQRSVYYKTYINSLIFEYAVKCECWKSVGNIIIVRRTEKIIRKLIQLAAQIYSQHHTTDIST